MPARPGELAVTSKPIALVIDDDAGVRELMDRFLTKEGWQVVGAASGREGLERARVLRPDVITLDVMMPGMDGWAVLGQLKSEPELAAIPVVMLTIVDNKSLGFTLGASDFLTKPVARERLLGAVGRYRRVEPSCDVLVVDDDPAARAALRGMLEAEGWSVCEAENGRDALERVASRLPPSSCSTWSCRRWTGLRSRPSCAGGPGGAPSRSSCSPPRTSPGTSAPGWTRAYARSCTRGSCRARGCWPRCAIFWPPTSVRPVKRRGE